jgi:hypothetical protein
VRGRILAVTIIGKKHIGKYMPCWSLAIGGPMPALFDTFTLKDSPDAPLLIRFENI